MTRSQTIKRAATIQLGQALDEASNEGGGLGRNELFRVWALIEATQYLSTKCESLEVGGSWDGVGKGQVVIKAGGSTRMDYVESGLWSIDHRPGIPFSNRLRWTWDSEWGDLSLYHLRLGPDDPVHLADFCPDPVRHGVLRARSVHRCGVDIYSPHIVLGADSFAIHWTVRGPRKGYRLRTEYRGGG